MTILGAAATIAIFAYGASTGDASAAALTHQSSAVSAAVKADAGMVEDVQARRDRRAERRYDRRRHGSRYRQRRRGYTHYHGGWYYRTPWWLALPFAPFVAPGARYSDAHVRWCMDRYRSYDPRTDSFLGYDGQWHRCNSPYG